MNDESLFADPMLAVEKNKKEPIFCPKPVHAQLLIHPELEKEMSSLSCCCTAFRWSAAVASIFARSKAFRWKPPAVWMVFQSIELSFWMNALNSLNSSPTHDEKHSKEER